MDRRLQSGGESKGVSRPHPAAAENRTELLEVLILDPSNISSTIADMVASPNNIGQYPLDLGAA